MQEGSETCVIKMSTHLSVGPSTAPGKLGHELVRARGLLFTPVGHVKSGVLRQEKQKPQGMT